MISKEFQAVRIVVDNSVGEIRSTLMELLEQIDFGGVRQVGIVIESHDVIAMRANEIVFEPQIVRPELAHRCVARSVRPRRNVERDTVKLNGDIRCTESNVVFGFFGQRRFVEEIDRVPMQIVKVETE